MPLTDICIRALQPPQEGAKIIYDDALPGFGVRITKSGVKSFVLTHGRRRHRETLGRVGIVSLKDARSAAKQILAEYTLGKHRPQARSWDAAKEEFLREKEGKRPSTYAAYKRHLKYFPIGNAKVAEITSTELQRDLDKIKRPMEREKTFVVLRAFINWCHQRHYTDRNPMERMKAPNHSKPRERILSNDEMKNIWEAAGDGRFGRIVKLLILTGQRRGEISNLTHDMVQGDRLVLPSWLCKNSREHRVPLSTSSQSLLAAMARNGKTSFVFPAKTCRDSKTSTSSPASFNGWSKSKAALDDRSGVKSWTLHDLRRTFASGLAALGVQIPVIERLLNHVSGTFAGIVGTYNRHDYWKEMTEAVEKWEAHILSITGQPSRRLPVPLQDLQASP